jgi:hypothetical protein
MRAVTAGEERCLQFGVADADVIGLPRSPLYKAMTI